MRSGDRANFSHNFTKGSHMNYFHHLFACLAAVVTVAALADDATTKPGDATKPVAATTRAVVEAADAEAAAKPDVLTGAVDPFDATDQKIKFLKTAGKTNELDAKTFEADRKTFDADRKAGEADRKAGEADRKAGGGLVMPFEKWETAVAFDANKNGKLDWFEFAEYRQAMRKAVLTACDKNKDNKLTGDERVEALKLLTAGKLVIKPEAALAKLGARPPQAAAADGGVGAASQPASQPTSRPSPADFATAFNELAGEGVTRENNAAVALLEVIGIPYGNPPHLVRYDDDMSRTAREQVAKRLGIDPDCGQPLPNFFEVEQEEPGVLRSPWTASDAPQMARRLAEMEALLNAAAVAVQRPQWFLPYSTSDDPDIPTLLTPAYSRVRELSKYFIARGFNNLGEGMEQEAWLNIQSASRLGALVGQDPSIMGRLISGSITLLANGATQRLAMNVTDKAMLQDMLDDLTNRPAVDMDRTLKGERLDWNGMVLTMMQSPEKWKSHFEWRGWVPAGSDGEDDEDDYGNSAGYERLREALRQADPAVVLRAYNQTVDERDTIVRMEDRQKMAAASDAFEKRLAEAKEKLRNQPPAPDASAQEKTQWVADLVATQSGIDAKTIRDKMIDNFEQNRRITMVAVALEMYKLDKGRYPERLDALSPTYLPAVPTDVFSGKAMMYKTRDKTYDLYSVGPNNKDDGSDLRFASETMRMQAEVKAAAK